jgi:hypothetical protein
MTEPLAEFTDMAGLEAALRQVREMRDISFPVLDQIAGLAETHSSKMLAPNGERGVTRQALGMLFGALGVRGVLVHDEKTWQRVQRYMAKYMLGKRNIGKVHADAVHIRTTRRFLKKIGKNGGKNSRKYMTPEQASEIGRRNGAKRWKKKRPGSMASARPIAAGNRSLRGR